MTFYLFLADRHGTSSGARWAIMGIAVKVGQSVGYFCTSSFIIFLISMWPRSLDWTAYVFLPESYPLEPFLHFLSADRDSGRWKVDPIETQRRRELFWELFTYDSWQCLTFGRPPSFALPHVDCKMPYPNDTSDEQSCKLLFFSGTSKTNS